MTTNGDGVGAAGPQDGSVNETAETGVEGGPGPDPVAALEAEKADLKDRLMRALAEMENLRRRSERDAAEARTYAVTGFARDVLTVADNLRRALESAPKDGPGEGAGQETVRSAVRSLVEGIELTERDLMATLARHKVRRIDPEGQRFDPNLHQAMFELPDDTVPNGTVKQVVQSGWVIGDNRVLRPALVGVSKGGPRASGPAERAGEDASPGRA